MKIKLLALVLCLFPSVGFATVFLDGQETGIAVADATTTVAGIVELATDAESVTGTDTDRAVTPAGLTARMEAPGEIGGTTPAVVNATIYKQPQTTSGAQVNLQCEDGDNGTDCVGVAAPASVTNPIVYIRPDGDPTPGQIKAWAAPSSVTFSDAVARDASAGSFTFIGFTKTASKSAAYTIGTDDLNECYGGVLYVTSAAVITGCDNLVAGMGYTVITIGATAVSLDMQSDDRMYLDGVALNDGDKATNTSTTGDIITCTYESAAGLYCASGSPDGDHWTDGGA